MKNPALWPSRNTTHTQRIVVNLTPKSSTFFVLLGLTLLSEFYLGDKTREELAHDPVY